MAKATPLKTRGGCVKCKQRRVKHQCGEERPQCKNCERLGHRGPCKFDVNFKAPKGRVPPKRHVLPAPAEKPLDLISWGSKEHNYYTQLDMELMHHFTNHTAESCARPGILEVWRTAIPALAYDHPCLMHGVISIAALHLATRCPARTPELLPKAMDSMQVGLPYFREHLSKLGPEHIHRGMAYALLVGFYAYASPSVQNAGRLFEFPIQVYLEASTLMSAGVVYIIMNNEAELKKGPLAAVFEGQQARILHPSEEAFSSYAKLDISETSSFKDTFLKRISLLDGLVQDYVHQYNLDTGACYHESLMHLSGLARRVLPETSVSGTDIDSLGQEPETLHLRWPTLTRGKFSVLLREGDIPALTILAHFAIFCGVRSWYMRGWRDSILVYAEQTVKVEPWRRQVRWLCSLARGQAPET